MSILSSRVKPGPMSQADIETTIEEYAQAARNANEAGFVPASVEACCAAIGRERVGIRLSPYGHFNSMPLYDEMEADYCYLSRQLNKTGLLYIHLAIRAEQDLAAGKADLIAVGRSFLANPNLVMLVKC